MGTTSDQGLLARPYLRVSVDKSGRERSHAGQQADHERAANELGWRLGEPYRDTGSASRYATKSRDDFDRLVADLEADRYGADVLMLWESSRGSRRLSEWARFLELLEDRGVLVHVTSHGRTYDLTNPRDRRTLQEDGTDAEYESGKISTRTTRNNALAAEEGRPHGRVPFGYRRVYDPRTGALLGQEPHPDEAAIVVELFERVAQGHSFRAIAADFAGRGITNDSGKPFSAQHLRSLVLMDAYRGKRIHIPGRRSGKQRGHAEPSIYEAQWPALVPERLFLTVKHIVTDPARKTTRGGRAKHLLSMIGACDVCGGPLAATYRSGSRQYMCHLRSCIRIPADELDALVEAAILGYLSRPDNVRRLTADETGQAELAKVRDEIAAIREELDDLGDSVGRGEVSATLASRAEPAILARLHRAEARAEELSTPEALRGFMPPGEDLGQRWAAAPVSTRREIARLLLVPEMLGELRVTRSPSRGHRVPATERVTWRTT